MKRGIYSLLKARFLVDQSASQNWRFILFLILLAIIMIANTHQYEQKVFRIAELNNEVKELRSRFVDRRSQLMKLRMESTISQKMEARGVKPSPVPPQKITVTKKESKGFWSSLWQE